MVGSPDCGIITTEAEAFTELSAWCNNLPEPFRALMAAYSGRFRDDSDERLFAPFFSCPFVCFCFFGDFTVEGTGAGASGFSGL
jgi:hypothetical protein